MPVNTEQIYDIAFRNFQGFLSEEDFDGLDLPPQFLQRAHNTQIRNGFVTNEMGINVDDLSALALSFLSLGDKLVYTVEFTHSTQGTFRLYVFQNTSSYALNFVLDETLLYAHYSAGNIVYKEMVHHVNSVMVNDQLKINLNCEVDMHFNHQPPSTCILNLTLIYLDESVDYSSGCTRSSGWLLTPRWLGWQYQDRRNNTAFEHYYTQLSPTGTLEIITGTNYTTKAIITGYSGLSVRASSTGFIGYNWGFDYSLVLYPGFEFAAGAYIKMEDLYTIGGVGFTAKMKTVGETGTLSVVTSRGHSQYVITDQEQDIAIRLDTIEPDGTFDVIIRNESDNVILTSALTMTGFPVRKAIVVSKTHDKQRFIIPDNMSLMLGLPTNSKITFAHWKDYIDYRVADYELYVQLEENGLYYLVAHAEVDGSWSEVTIDGELYMQREMEYYDSNEVQTLNFNYGLGASVLIGDNQREIWSEVTLRGRQYFVKGDYRIYQSHIAGAGLLQPDSFPYDIDTKYGFIEGEEGDAYTAIKTSVYKELVIFSANKTLVMQIQYNSGGVAFKQLKIAGRNVGLSVAASLVEIRNALMWIDGSGLYVYGGGQQPPRNLVSAEYKHYWRSVTEGGTIKMAFYHSRYNEYWIQNSTGFIVYEIDYGKFRNNIFHPTYLPVDASADVFFAGYSSNVPYEDFPLIIFKSLVDGTYHLGGISLGKKLPMDFITHYSSGELPYSVDKFLHSVYIGFKKTTTQNISVNILVDGKSLPTFQIKSTQGNEIVRRLAPIGVRFNKIAFVITSEENDSLNDEITEIGCKCSIITPPRGATGEGVLSGGYGTGYGSNYGEQL